MLNITNTTRVLWVVLAVMAAMTSPETSAQSATDAGSLEAGLAAEEQGDWKAALLLLEPLAERGNPRAQDRLGYMYDLGEGVHNDNTVAAKWYRKAAEQGNADAQDRLGYMYENGEGIPQDKTEAAKWYRKAAEQGNADAQMSSTRLSAELALLSGGTAKSTVPDFPDPPLQDPKEARVALNFLERQLTISVNFTGDPEPGLASVRSTNGGLCHLRCGFHLAEVGFGGGVEDTEIEFALSDINIDTVRYDSDGLGRSMISFGTSDGTPRFSRRDREMDMKQKVLSAWAKWEATDKGFCRAQSDTASLERAVNALKFLAKSCGAKTSPF